MVLLIRKPLDSSPPDAPLTRLASVLRRPAASHARRLSTPAGGSRGFRRLSVTVLFAEVQPAILPPPSLLHRRRRRAAGYGDRTGCRAPVTFPISRLPFSTENRPTAMMQQVCGLAATEQDRASSLEKQRRQLNILQAAIATYGVTMGLFGVMVVAVIIVFWGQMIIQKKKFKKVKQEYFRQHGGLLLFDRMKSEKGLAFTVFSEAELIHATSNFDNSKILGKGGHGTVYKGVINNKKQVAVKRCALVDERQKKEFGQEMLILSQINHKNIVKLLGCCLEVEVPILVYEFVLNGTLFELIHGKNQALQISFSTLLRIAHEAAEGLSFLHSYASTPIIHGDVKTSNILLDENYMAKVSDFGASILAPTDKEQFVTMVQGTCGYLDPEYMQTCQLTDKSDVYSFGVILLEILTGQLPLKLEGSETQRSLSSVFLSAMKENNLDAVLVSHVKGQESMELLRGLADLAKNCLDMCGDNRPSMKEVADELNRLRKLSLHPWVRLNVETDAESLLSGESTGGYEIELSGYPMGESENQPINPRSSYYAR
ncbi:hypothetical protein BRADI_5g15797v3 [Brachypodium distachyon]|uniref:Protein kinase domain-containing protein n=1 Tax=Brachypodium distachyon TaxID=15368 RepID=A0A2K2CHI2_BRADI|nr:hypothetical protein BRADI_5g15797v3 [Brachypodium distachyon]